MNARLENKSLKALAVRRDELNFTICMLPVGTDAHTLMILRTEWKKVNEALRLFCYHAKPSLTASGHLMRH